MKHQRTFNLKGTPYSLMLLIYFKQKVPGKDE